MYYGAAPVELGFVDVHAAEMCLVQYLPVFMDGDLRIPVNLDWCRPVVKKAIYNLPDLKVYVYLTAKHFWSNGSMNRAGWHSDGFLSDDINFIWYDSVPTKFCVQPFDLTLDHQKSMEEMGEQADTRNIVTYPNKHLLMMDERTIHRVNETGSGLRTFIKVSASNNRYNLQGNAHNYLFDYSWTMHERSETRNDPAR